MSRQISFTQQKSGHISPAAENADTLWRKCRHCGKSFKAAKAYYFCCSWDCTQAHKQSMSAPDPSDAEYKGHPF